MRPQARSAPAGRSAGAGPFFEAAVTLSRTRSGSGKAGQGLVHPGQVGRGGGRRGPAARPAPGRGPGVAGRWTPIGSSASIRRGGAGAVDGLLQAAERGGRAHRVPLEQGHRRASSSASSVAVMSPRALGSSLIPAAARERGQPELAARRPASEVARSGAERPAGSPVPPASASLISGVVTFPPLTVAPAGDQGRPGERGGQQLGPRAAGQDSGTTRGWSCRGPPRSRRRPGRPRRCRGPRAGRRGSAWRPRRGRPARPPASLPRHRRPRIGQRRGSLRSLRGAVRQPVGSFPRQRHRRRASRGNDAPGQERQARRQRAARRPGQARSTARRTARSPTARSSTRGTGSRPSEHRAISELRRRPQQALRPLPAARLGEFDDRAGEPRRRGDTDDARQAPT